MTATTRTGAVRYKYEHVAYAPAELLRWDSVSPPGSDVQLEYGGRQDDPVPHADGALYKRVRNVVTGRTTYFVRDFGDNAPVAPPSLRMKAVRKPIGLVCGARGSEKRCGGLMARIDLSRLEEGLGHEGFECASCHRRVKYVPPGDR